MQRDRVWYGAWFMIGLVVGMFVSDLIIREPLREDNRGLHVIVARCDSMLNDCQGRLLDEVGGQVQFTDSTWVRMIEGVADTTAALPIGGNGGMEP